MKKSEMIAACEGFSQIRSGFLNSALILIVFAFPLSNSLAETETAGGREERIAQLVACEPIRRNYPGALSSLLEELVKQTTVKLDPEPVLIKSFDAEEIFKYPFIYANFADRENWDFTPAEIASLKEYLERGGFIFIDAGVNAEFLRKDISFGQHHSYADWQVTPELANAFKKVFPDNDFKPLHRNHEIFRTFYEGLPDSSKLPDSVREYVVNEKWPDGTYSLLALELKGRIAVLVSPIISMGWGRDAFGNWTTKINFRVREGAEGLSEKLRSAAYSGARFEAVLEDGRKDVIYCQTEALPAWVQEPDGRWRVFRYYQSNEISDFAHVFYTRLGINIFMYAYTH